MKWTPIIAIVCVAGLLGLALVNHINGALMATGFTIIGGLGGYEAKILRDKAKGGKDAQRKE